MENLGIASVAAITVITYLMGMAVRASRMDNKWIPTICALLGVAVAVWISWPVVNPGVILSGLASGLASTGLHQAYSQLIRTSENK